MKFNAPGSFGLRASFRSAFQALLVAAAVLLGSPSSIQRCAAGVGFPTTPTNGQTFSIGVFEVVVDPSFAFLFAPSNSTSYYPGYAGPGSGILTSPVMYDGNTMIGESASQVVGSEVFPAAAGTPSQYPPNTTYSNILGYTDYALIPSPFVTVPNGGVVPVGVDTIFTEIEQLDLLGYADTNGVPCNDPRVPGHDSVTGQGGGVPVTVKAGPGAFGIGPSLPLNRRSIGYVQQITPGGPTDPDFPAQSFFDIFVEVDLPQVPGTVAGTVFPAAGAVLYNDASDPLLIENLSLTNLPPEATYVHGQTTAVPIRFRDNNPPFWSADQVLGYLTLAGHGVFTNPITASAPCAAATSTGGLLDLTLGPVGSPLPAPPIPWLRPDNLIPSTNSSYAMLVNRPVSSGVTNYLDDVVSFGGGPSAFSVRALNFGNFSGSVSPPSPNTTAIDNEPSVLLTCEVSPDGVNYYSVIASGTLSMSISNNGTGNPAMFSTELLSMDCIGSIVGGPFDGVMFELRESPTKASLGRHTIAPDPRGYRISSFFDVFTELSIDGGPFNPASKSVRVQATMPPPVPQTIYVKSSGNKIALLWQNSFTLQSATDVKGPWTDVPGPILNGPYTNTISPTRQFFRLRQ